MSHRRVCTLSTIVVAALASMLPGCGGKGGTETSEPPPPKDNNSNANTAKQPLIDKLPANPPPTQVTPRGFWSASRDSLELRRHDSSLKIVDTCDLTSSDSYRDTAAGGISALAFVNKGALLAVVDPGDGNESIALVDVSQSPCKASVWFGPSPVFSALTSTSIAAFPMQNTDYMRVFASRPEGADRFTWTSDNTSTRAAGPGDAPFVPGAPAGPGNCTAGSITGMAILGEGDGRVMLLLSKGEGATRLNVVASLMGGASGNPTCLSSHDYAAAGLPTSAADTPVQAIQASDKRIYVLFENPQTGGKLVRYDFNGYTLLSPNVISQDPDDVGYAPKALANPAPGQLLVATGQLLTLLDAATGRLVRPWRDPWASRISALAIEPQ